MGGETAVTCDSDQHRSKAERKSYAYSGVLFSILVLCLLRGRHGKESLRTGGDAGALVGGCRNFGSRVKCIGVTRIEGNSELHDNEYEFIVLEKKESRKELT